MDTISTTANEQLCRRVFDDIVNGRDLDLIDELYQPDVVDHDPVPGAPPGRPGVRYSIGSLQAAFPDLHVRVDAASAHADKVVVHNTWTGTQDGRLVGLPPTGRRVSNAGIVIFRVRDGRIAERWAMVDWPELGAGRERRGAVGRSSLASSSLPKPVAFVDPIRHGQLAAWRRHARELRETRREEYEESRRRAGIAREIVWRQGPDHLLRGGEPPGRPDPAGDVDPSLRPMAARAP
jgi:predicted ester cyclase